MPTRSLALRAAKVSATDTAAVTGINKPNRGAVVDDVIGGSDENSNGQESIAKASGSIVTENTALDNTTNDAPTPKATNVTDNNQETVAAAAAGAAAVAAAVEVAGNDATTKKSPQIRKGSRRKKKKGKRFQRDNAQLFALFQPASISSNADATTADSAIVNILINARPKRKLKSVKRYDGVGDYSHSILKTGEGFVCPRCLAPNSYDSKQCGGCGLECCYEAGVGVVILRERRRGYFELEGVGNDGGMSDEVVSQGCELSTRNTGDISNETMMGLDNDRNNDLAAANEIDRDCESRRYNDMPEAGANEGNDTSTTAEGNNATEEDKLYDIMVEEGTEGDMHDGNDDESAIDGDANAIVAGESAGGNDAINNGSKDASFSSDRNDELNGLAKSNDAELTRQASTLQAKHAEKVNALHTKEMALGELENKFDTLLTERDELKRKAKTVSADLIVSQEEVSKFSSEVKTLRADMAMIQAERDFAKERAAKLASSSFIVAAERDRLKSQLEDANAKLLESITAKKKRALQDLTNMESRHKMKATSVDERLAKQTSSNFIVAAERDKLALQLKDANTRIKAVEAEKNEFQAKADSATRSKDRAVQDMAKTEDEQTTKVSELHSEIESLKQQLSEASAQITTISTEKTNLMTRIASVLEDDMAKVLRTYEVELDEARETIEAMKAEGSSGSSTSYSTELTPKTSNSTNASTNVRNSSREATSNASSSTSSSSMANGNSNSIHSARKVSSEDTEHQPYMTTFRSIMRGKGASSTNNGNVQTPLSPRKKTSSTSRPKSAMINSKRGDSSLPLKKRRDPSSLAAPKGGRVGRVNFDSETSFERTTNRAKFDIFSSPAHGKENVSSNSKKNSYSAAKPLSSSGCNGGTSSSRQTSGTSSCEGSNFGGGRRRKNVVGKSVSSNKLSLTKPVDTYGFEDDGGFL